MWPMPRRHLPPGRPVLDAVLHLTDRIHQDFKFDTKATTILLTPLEQVMKSRRGVCQDFAHLEIGFLRSMGIPARYVSGVIWKRIRLRASQGWLAPTLFACVDFILLVRASAGSTWIPPTI